MKEVSHSFFQFVGLMFVAGLVMSYARWMISGDPHRLRIIVGWSIINAFCGSTSLVILIIKPDMPDYGLYGIAFGILLIGPITFTVLFTKLIENKIGLSGDD